MLPPPAPSPARIGRVRADAVYESGICQSAQVKSPPQAIDVLVENAFEYRT